MPPVTPPTGIGLGVWEPPATGDARLPVAVAPRSSTSIDEAITGAGGRRVPLADAVGLVWTDQSGPNGLAEALAGAPALRWVQLPWAGVEPFLGIIASRSDLFWTCAKGAYAAPVAEHALGLLLAGFRNLGPFARAGEWTTPAGRNLLGARVTIVGGGGITRSLLGLLGPFGCEITVVRRHPDDDDPRDGAVRVLSAEQLNQALDGAEALVLALPLSAATRGLVGAAELARLAPGAVVVNVARGEHLDTDALVAALESGQVGAAGLDVTDPERLPDDHRLWRLPQVIVTPHTANTPAMARPLLAARIADNVAALVAGGPLFGLIDAELGY